MMSWQFRCNLVPEHRLKHGDATQFWAKRLQIWEWDGMVPSRGLEDWFPLKIGLCSGSFRAYVDWVKGKSYFCSKPSNPWVYHSLTQPLRRGEARAPKDLSDFTWEICHPSIVRGRQLRKDEKIRINSNHFQSNPPQWMMFTIAVHCTESNVNGFRKIRGSHVVLDHLKYHGVAVFSKTKSHEQTSATPKKHDLSGAMGRRFAGYVALAQSSSKISLFKMQSLI